MGSTFRKKFVFAFDFALVGGKFLCLQGHTVHKLNDCLHPMECIPETQFVMRSKIHLAVLLHLQCKCEREEDSQFGQILL
jgi:hypothetical protein